MRLKPLFKKLLKSKLFTKLAGWLAVKYMGLIRRTNSWHWINEEIPKAYWDSNRPFVVCFWHGRMAMLAFSWRHSSAFHMLISGHRDGKTIAQAVHAYGFKTISGSSSKGGRVALSEILRVLKSGDTIGLTPDGPRGPRFKVNPGLIAIARMTKLDIVPITFSTQRRIVLKSWDRLWFPLPFGKGVYMWGEPLTYATLKTKTDQKDLALELERRLNRLNSEADAFCGHLPLEEVPTDKEEASCSS